MIRENSIEKIIIVNSVGKKLAANFYGSYSNKKLIIVSHGFNEDKTLQGTILTYVKDLLARDISVLAYDFSGFGQSDPEFCSRSTVVNDLKSVIQWAKKQFPGVSLGLFGHSLGSSACFENYSKEIFAIAAIGAVTGAMPFPMEKIFLPEQFVEFELKGYARELRTYGTRPEILVDKKVLDECRNVDQKKLLSRIYCPVLLIHGDAEAEENSLYELSKRGMAYLHEGSQLYFIHGAGHNFVGFTQEVSQKVSAWFAEITPLNF